MIINDYLLFVAGHYKACNLASKFIFQEVRRNQEYPRKQNTLPKSMMELVAVKIHGRQ